MTLKASVDSWLTSLPLTSTILGLYRLVKMIGSTPGLDVSVGFSGYGVRVTLQYDGKITSRFYRFGRMNSFKGQTDWLNGIKSGQDTK